MKVIQNNIIPFKGFLAINLFGVVFARKDAWDRTDGWRKLCTINHESIHTAQMRELLYIGFYLLYFLEWVYRLIFHTKTAYEGISFEKEAYAWETDMTYIKNRKHFAQWRKH